MRAEPLDLGVRVELLLAQNRMGTTKGDHATGEAENVPVLFQTSPVMPARCVILAVGVIVAALRAAHLVAAEQHWHTARDEQSQQEVLDLAFPQSPDHRIGCLAFGAVVFAEVVVCPIPVVFAICFIVLVAIAHQIVQSEPIVAGDEVDAAFWAFARLGVDIGAATDAAGKQTNHPIIATPESPNLISEPVVPFRPTPL